MKVAYVFSTSGHTATYKLGQMILPQLERDGHGAPRANGRRACGRGQVERERKRRIRAGDQAPSLAILSMGLIE